MSWLAVVGIVAISWIVAAVGLAWGLGLVFRAASDDAGASAERPATAATRAA